MRELLVSLISGFVAAELEYLLQFTSVRNCTSNLQLAEIQFYDANDDLIQIAAISDSGFSQQGSTSFLIDGKNSTFWEDHSLTHDGECGDGGPRILLTLPDDEPPHSFNFVTSLGDYGDDPTEWIFTTQCEDNDFVLLRNCIIYSFHEPNPPVDRSAEYSQMFFSSNNIIASPTLDPSVSPLLWNCTDGLAPFYDLNIRSLNGAPRVSGISDVEDCKLICEISAYDCVAIAFQPLSPTNSLPQCWQYDEENWDQKELHFSEDFVACDTLQPNENPQISTTAVESTDDNEISTTEESTSPQPTMSAPSSSPVVVSHCAGAVTVSECRMRGCGFIAGVCEPHCRVSENVAIVGGSVTYEVDSLSKDDCELLCRTEAECAAFAHATSANKCFLYSESGMGDPQDASFFTSGFCTVRVEPSISPLSAIPTAKPSTSPSPRPSTELPSLKPFFQTACHAFSSRTCRDHGCAYWDGHCYEQCEHHYDNKISRGVLIGVSEFPNYHDCGLECLHNPECMIFQFNHNSQECHLWESYEKMEFDEDYVSGICFIPPPPEDVAATVEDDEILGLPLPLLISIFAAAFILPCLIYCLCCATKRKETQNSQNKEKMIAIEMVAPDQVFFAKSEGGSKVPSPHRTPQGSRFVDALPPTPDSASTPRRNPESSRIFLMQPLPGSGSNRIPQVNPPNGRHFTQTPSVDMISMDDQDTFRMQAGLGAYGPPPSRVLVSGNTQTYETNIDSETSAIHQPISYESSVGTVATASFGGGNVLYGSVYSNDSSSISSMMSATSVTSEQWTRQAVNAPTRREHRTFGSISTVSSYPTIPGSTFRSTVESRKALALADYEETRSEQSKSTSHSTGTSGEASSITRNYNSPIDVDSLRQRIPSVATLKSDAFLQIYGSPSMDKPLRQDGTVSEQTQQQGGKKFPERTRASTIGTVLSAATLTSTMIDQSYMASPTSGSSFIPVSPNEDPRYRLQSAATLASDAFLEYNHPPQSSEKAMIKSAPLTLPKLQTSEQSSFPEVPKVPSKIEILSSKSSKLAYNQQFSHHQVPLESPDAANKNSGVKLISATRVTPVWQMQSNDPEVSSVLSGNIPDLPPEKSDFGGAAFSGDGAGPENPYENPDKESFAMKNPTHVPTIRSFRL